MRRLSLAILFALAPAGRAEAQAAIRTFTGAEPDFGTHLEPHGTPGVATPGQTFTALPEAYLLDSLSFWLGGA